jgi:hypothetical protein
MSEMLDARFRFWGEGLERVGISHKHVSLSMLAIGAGGREESHNACVGELQTQHRRQYKVTSSALSSSSDARNELGIAYMLVNIEDRNRYQG